MPEVGQPDGRAAQNRWVATSANDQWVMKLPLTRVFWYLVETALPHARPILGASNRVTKNSEDRATLQVMAYRVLSQDLMAGRYKPGQAVSLRPLAARLGTSPMPIREAVSRLIAERALVLLPNRNVIVPLMTRKRLIELSRARQLLEGAAAHSACANLTPALLTKLTRLNDQLKHCLSNAQIRPALSHNLNFHFALYRAFDEEVILPLIEMLWRQAGPFVALTPKMPGVKWTAEFHDHILTALKEGDARAAKRAIEQDIESTTLELLRNADFI